MQAELGARTAEVERQDAAARAKDAETGDRAAADSGPRGGGLETTLL